MPDILRDNPFSLTVSLGKDGLSGNFSFEPGPITQDILMYNRQLAVVLPFPLACVALHLAAGRSGQCAGFDKHNRKSLDIMRLRNICTHRFHSFIGIAPVFAAKFAYDYKSFLPILFHRKCSAYHSSAALDVKPLPSFQGLEGSRDPGIDDAILEPPGNEELAV